MTALTDLLRTFVASSEREEADRCTMLRLATELEHPLSRAEPSAHFTASALVVDAACERACLAHAARAASQPGDMSRTRTTTRGGGRCASGETGLELAST